MLRLQQHAVHQALNASHGLEEAAWKHSELWVRHTLWTAMAEKRRPVSVLVVAGLYVAVGTVGFVAHFPTLSAMHRDDVLIELTELVALVAGVYLLRGQNWARWLTMAWIAFHVGISLLDGIQPVVIHCVLCIGIAWGLFHSAANEYFRRQAETSQLVG
jgi:hypothetical protein